MTAWWHRSSRLAAAAAVLLAMTGCVSIPDSSPVREGREVDVQGEPHVINNQPAGPSPGAAPIDIVSGYFAAMLAYPQTDEVARQFLTPTAAENWDSGAGLVVYENNDQTMTENASGVLVSSRILGSLDSRGSWSTADPDNAEVNVSLRLTQIDGEWRIVNPLPGTYVDRDYFARSYAHLSMYYFDPTKQVLAPDLVYLMIGDETPTELVANLLLGPTRELTGVVQTMAPQNLELDGQVRITGAGTAAIPLTHQFLTLDEEDRQLLAAQLTWTLRQIPDIEDIVITIDGQGIDVVGVGTRIGVDEFAGYDPAGLEARPLFALSSRGLVTLDDNGVVQMSGPVDEASRAARSVGIDLNAQAGAVVSDDGTTLTVGGLNPGSTLGAQTWLTGATDLLRPSWDLDGVLWSVDRRAGNAQVRSMTGPNRGRVVPTPWDRQLDVQGFAVSRDGVRFAAVLSDRGTARLVIAKIDRSAATPGRVELLRAREVISPDVALNGISGLAWASPTEVVLLANGEAGDRQLYSVSIDGSVVEGMTGFLPSRPLTVAAGSSTEAPLAIGGRNGKVYVQTPDLQWAEVPSTQRLRAPTYPG